MEAFLPYIFIAVLFMVWLNTVPVMILVERKVSGWLQYRVGPNRVGPW